MTIRPFRIAIGEDVLADLRDRLARTRWPDAVAGAGWGAGMDPAALRAWCDRWRAGFDWRAQEERLNALPQFVMPVDGLDLHFVHARSADPDALPLLLMNGWPSTFAELSRLAAPLTAGGGDGPAFHVVIPSLPGYGFSGRPAVAGWNVSRMAGAMARLMDALGYGRFGVHGSDLGAGVMLALAAQAPERVVAAHSVNVYWGYPPPADLGDEERAYLDRARQWDMAEGAYAMVQATKPQTLAAGLNDSPAGLAAWVLEKWQGWSDGGLDAHREGDVLANLTIYWATGTIGSSVRLYHEVMGDEGMRALGRSEVPAGVLVLPADILPAPRAWGERWLDLRRWTEAERGGHFPALEVPDLLVAELRALFADVAR